MIHVCVLCMVNRPDLSPLSPEHRTLLEAIVSPVINTAEIQAFPCQWQMCETCKLSMQIVYNFQQTALVGVKNLLLYLKTQQHETAIEETKPVVFVKVETPPEVPTAASKDNFITIEAPRNVNLLTEELIVKLEPEPPDSARHGSGHAPTGTQPHTTNPPPNSQVTKDCPVTQQVRVRNIHQMRVLNTQHIRVPNMQVQVPNTQQIPVTYIQPVRVPNTHQVRVPNMQVRVPNTQQARVMPVGAEREGNFEVFTHQPQPKNMTNYNYVNGVLTCPLCPRVFVNKNGYVSHMRKHEGRERKTPKVRKKYIRKQPQRVTCPHCDKSLRSNDSLKIHMVRSHGEISLCECDVCGKQCRNETALKLHKYTHTYKEIKASRETIDTMRPELFCTECCIQLASRSAYRIHLMTRKHTPKEHYKFECSTCKAKFLDDSRLQQHVEVVHLRQGAYKCDKCGKNYGTETALRRHNIDIHEKRPRSKTPLICHLCGKTFTIRKSLKEHLLKHEGLRPHQCPLCPATFTYEAALYTHNRLKHLKIKRKRKKKLDKDGEESAENCDGDGGKVKRKVKKKVKDGEENSADSGDGDGGKMKRKKVEKDGEKSAESCDGDGGKIKRKKKVEKEGEEKSAENYDGDAVEELLKII